MLPRCHLLPAPGQGEPAAGSGRSKATASVVTAGLRAHGREGTGRAHPRAGPKVLLRGFGEGWSGSGGKGGIDGGRRCCLEEIGKKREVVRPRKE